MSSAEPTPPSEWEWFGCPAHLIVSNDCRFHLATLVGKYIVSTVGEWLPDSEVREIFAETKGITLQGRGDDRRADYMKRVGYKEIGLDRLYETMVFEAGDRCAAPECNCGVPNISGSEVDFDAYNLAGDATRGHMAMCKKWAAS